MSNTLLTRRDLMLAAACWSELLHSAGKDPELVTFTKAEAAEIEAMAAQIVPEDDGTPGAKTAGVIFFIDRTLAAYDTDRRALYRSGLAGAQLQRAALFPDSASIAALTREQCIALLRSLETTDFFRTLRLHTVLGFFGHPKYGGNREMAGWKHIGFAPAMHHAHPFGAYDGDEPR